MFGSATPIMLYVNFPFLHCIDWYRLVSVGSFIHCTHRLRLCVYSHVYIFTCRCIHMSSVHHLLSAFPFERPMFMREYSTGTYSAVAYFLAKLSMEMPLNFAQIGISYLLAYNMMELNGSWYWLWLTSWALGMASGSMAVLLGCAVSDIKTVTELSPLLFVPQLLFAGFFIKTSQIPIFLRWAQYLCSLK